MNLIVPTAAWKSKMKFHNFTDSFDGVIRDGVMKTENLPKRWGSIFFKTFSSLYEKFLLKRNFCMFSIQSQYFISKLI